MSRVNTKRQSVILLKFSIYAIATIVFVSMLWFPQTEGRVVGLDLYEIYTDPVIIYMYISSIPFFVGLHQAVRLLNFVDTGKAFSSEAVNALKNMRIASLSLIGLIATGLIYLRFVVKGEDLAGPTMLGICLSLVFAVIAIAANVFQKLLQKRR